MTWLRVRPISRWKRLERFVVFIKYTETSSKQLNAGML